MGTQATEGEVTAVDIGVTGFTVAMDSTEAQAEVSTAAAVAAASTAEGVAAASTAEGAVAVSTAEGAVVTVAAVADTGNLCRR
jgi:hypothetical protein